MGDSTGDGDNVNMENNETEGRDGLSQNDGRNGDVGNNEVGHVESHGEPMDENSNEEDEVDEYRIDNIGDLKRVDFMRLNVEEYKKYHLISQLVAFEFYNTYACKRRFASRRWNVLKNKRGEVTQQEFVCFKERFRDKKHLERKGRKREPRAMTRCGCTTSCCVRLDRESGRWWVKAFNDSHSHELLGEEYVEMLPAHRKMGDADLMHLNSMREAGIGVT
ncbi:FAR1 DNA-binding domain [Sesbania bispinosa]|nr:FAR1 DNA-binding domain [Sesbania bispinosa]